ncbi:hypothetical protein J7K28_08805 [Candidatus Aerophobetes bacterium]|nr:hypothetical protein [Candidatus Aerophobetes bacterium]
MRIIVIIMISLFLFFHNQINAQELATISQIDDAFNCLVSSIKFYAQGGRVFSKANCNIEARKGWKENYVLIDSKVEFGVNPRIGYFISAHFPKKFLIKNTNEFIQKIKNKYNELRNCIKFFLERNKFNPNPAMNPLYQESKETIPSYCHISGGNPIVFRFDNKAFRESATKINTNKTIYLDFIKHIYEEF